MSRRPALLAALALAPLGAPSGTPLGAQSRTVVVAPTFESWRFGPGLYQFDGSDSVGVRQLSQLAVPWRASAAFGRRLTVQLDGAYASGTVQLRGPDPRLRADRYTLAGPTDTRLRVVGAVIPDRVLVTLGATAPTGRTTLAPAQLAAVRVLAAPAFGLATSAVSGGGGSSAGVIVTQPLGRWALALGGSYELRRRFTPVQAIVSGLGAPDYTPGNTVHLSVAADRLVGASRMTVALTTDLYGTDRLTLPTAAGPAPDVTVRLGPTVSLDWQLRLASPVARDLTLYLAERYRAPFTRAGARVDGSAAHQVVGGVHGVLPIAERTGLVVDLDTQWYTGLRVDRALATAPGLSTGLTLGLQLGGRAGGPSATPFVRGRYGVVGANERAASGTALAAGVTLGSAF